jgi:hypothetical protein
MIPDGLHIGYDGKFFKKEKGQSILKTSGGQFLFLFFLFFESKNRPDLTSHLDPQVKLYGRGPAGVSPALH